MERDATQPIELMFVRHGESEANRVQQWEKRGDVSPYAAEVYGRHDFQHHLTARGVSQAKAARAVLVAEGVVPEKYFDEYYVSTFIRPIETMAYLTDGKVDPLPDVRLIERDWGHYGSTPLAERRERFAETERLKKMSAFYTRYDGGQNIPDVIGNFRDWLSTQNRENTNRRVLAVVHGEKMWAARFVLEGLTPSQWEEMDRDKSLRIGNCCILWYSRRNPDDPGDVSRTISGGWRRMIDPIDRDRSPYTGTWNKLPGRTRLLGREILAAAELVKRMPDDDPPTPAV